MSCSTGLHNAIKKILNKKPWYRYIIQGNNGIIHLLNSQKANINFYTSYDAAIAVAAHINNSINNGEKIIGDVAFPRKDYTERGVVIIEPLNAQLDLLNTEDASEIIRLQDKIQTESETIQQEVDSTNKKEDANILNDNIGTIREWLKQGMEEDTFWQKVEELGVSKAQINTFKGVSNDLQTKEHSLNLSPKTEKKDSQTPTRNTQNIYSKLGNKTATGNVIIKSVYQQEGIQYAKSIGGVFSLRVNNSNKHFGNPFSNVQSEIDKGLTATKSTKESVEKYIDWVINSQDERAIWIRGLLKSGILKGKPIVYYKELGEPSHATALDYLINRYDWNSEQPINKEIKPNEYTNHSGGAYGGDTLWDLIGREFGVTEHRHYRDAGNTSLSQKLRNNKTQATVLTSEQMDFARQKVKELLGIEYKDDLRGNLQVRNFYQVYNADAVYAIAKLNETKDGVKGGTNTAVQLSIKLNKPVYVWDILTEQWYIFEKATLDKDGLNYELFVPSDTPTLTKNFAGVGSRDIENYNIQKDGKWQSRKEYVGKEKEEKAKQAIREVYEKTFKQQLYSQYLEQNPNGSVEGFKSWVDEFNRSNIKLNSNIQIFSDNKQGNFDSSSLKDDDLALMLFNQALGTNLTSINQLNWDNVKDNIFFEKEDGSLGVKNLAFTSGNLLSTKKATLNDFINQKGLFPKYRVFIGESVIYPNVFEVFENEDNVIKQAVFDNLFNLSGAFEQVKKELNNHSPETFIIETPNGEFTFPKRFAAGFWNIARKVELLLKENQSSYIQDYLANKEKREEVIKDDKKIKPVISQTLTVNDVIVQNAIGLIGNSIIENAIKNNTSVKIQVFSNAEYSEDGIAGWYLPKSNTIYLHESMLKPQHLSEGLPLIAHELIHSVTEQSLRYDKNFQKEIQSLLNRVKNQSEIKDFYGFKNTSEFLSEAFSSQEFRQLLKDTQFSNTEKLSVWQKFVNAILKLFGKNKRYFEKVHITNAEQILNNIINQHSYKIGFVTSNIKDEIYPNKKINNNSFQQFQQSLNKPNTNPILQGNQQEQVKKFAELQERLNNKEFLEGAKNVFESNEELQNVYYEALGVGQNIKTKKTGLLDYFLNVKKDSVFQELIQIGENLGIGIEEYESDSPLQANWNGKNVTINKTYGKVTSNVIAHEVVHGILHTLTNNDYTNSKLNLKLEKFKTELFDYIEKKGINNLNLPSELRILKLDYIKKMSNQEIVTYAFTDSQFSDFLASIKTDTKVNSNESFWNKLINIFNTALKELGFTSKLDELIDILNTEVPLFNNVQIIPQQKQDALNAYTDYLARVSLGIIKNPTSGEYNYDSKVKDIVYHGTKADVLEGEEFSKDKLGSYTGANSAKLGFFFTNLLSNAQNYNIYSSKHLKIEKELISGGFDYKELYKLNLVTDEDFNSYTTVDDSIDYLKPEVEERLKRTNPELLKNNIYEYHVILTAIKGGDVDEYLNSFNSEVEAENYIENISKNLGGNIFSIILNMKNPHIKDFQETKEQEKEIRIVKEITEEINKALNKNKDGVIIKNYIDPVLNDEYIVFEPEQIHILSSKADIQGFKEFVNKDNSLSENEEIGATSFEERQKERQVEQEDNTLQYRIPTREEIEECLKKPKAENGAKFSKFTKGSEWEVVSDLGVPSFTKGGEWRLEGAAIHNTSGSDSPKIKAEKGIVISKFKPTKAKENSTSIYNAIPAAIDFDINSNNVEDIIADARRRKDVSLYDGNSYKTDYGQDESGEYISFYRKDGNTLTDLFGTSKEYYDRRYIEPRDILKLKTEGVTINDNRRINNLTGAPLKNNKKGVYGYPIIEQIIKAANKYEIDPYVAISMALQETNLGKTGAGVENPFHMNGGIKETPENLKRYAEYFKNMKKDKGDIIDRAMNMMKNVSYKDMPKNPGNYSDEIWRIQSHNGWGYITPNTEIEYDGGGDRYEMKIPKEGVSMKKNPIYGRFIKQLKDESIATNKDIQRLVEYFSKNSSKIIKK